MHMCSSSGKLADLFYVGKRNVGAVQAKGLAGLCHLFPLLALHLRTVRSRNQGSGFRDSRMVRPDRVRNPLCAPL